MTNRLFLFVLSLQTHIPVLLALILVGQSICASRSHAQNASTIFASDTSGDSIDTNQVAQEADATLVLDLKFNSDFGEQESIGEVITEYQDGSLLFLTPDGQLWTIYGKDVISRKVATKPFKPMTSEEIYEKIKAELPAGFAIHKTNHYVIVYNTNKTYALWVGQLFEKVYRTFYNYWRANRKTRRILELEEPRFPLVALVFRDRASYSVYAEREIGQASTAMIGYYNQRTNRMVSYDLTGVSGGAANERTVATIVHEAVHQISYNSGLQVRLAANPRWLSEGLAMFFESPDRRNLKEWSMGKVNDHNLRLFAQYARSRPANSLATLVANDDRLLDSQKALYAYPESWALTYYLVRARTSDYASYLKDLSTLTPLGDTSERECVDLFKKHFGDDFAELDRQFMKYMRTVKPQ